MNRPRMAYVMAMLLVLGCAPLHADTSWKPAKGQLMTTWSAQVSPEEPLPEYPRPAMVRQAWMNLNGLWQFSELAPGAAPEPGRPLPGTILVPFCPESALSGVMKGVDRVAYRRTFDVPAPWTGKRPSP